MTEYIEKEAVCEDAKKWFKTSDMKLYNDCVQMVRNRVTALPAANVRENVKGEWDMDSVAFYRKCPNCKCCVRDNRYEVFLDNGDLHYCPNCGAQMMEGAENG